MFGKEEGMIEFLIGSTSIIIGIALCVFTYRYWIYKNNTRTRFGKVVSTNKYPRIKYYDKDEAVGVWVILGSIVGTVLIIVPIYYSVLA